MKHIKYLLFLLFTITTCLSLGAKTHNEQLWEEASALYADKKYEDAAQKYNELLQYGESASLYYNYGNSLYKSNHIGLAILNYERALRLDPTNEDIQFNLDFANKTKTDKIEPIEQFFVISWINALGKFLTSNQWAYLSIILFSIALALLLLYLFGRQMWVRKTAFFTFIFLFIFSICSMAYAFSIKNSIKSNPCAIVLSGSVSVKSSPDDSGTEVFVLHEGTKVSISSRLGDWSEIQLGDGNMGWLLTSSIEII